MQPSIPAASQAADLELLELVSSLVCILHDNEIVFMNSAGLRMLGLESLEHAVGQRFESFIVEDYRFLLEAGWSLLAEEDFLPLKILRSDGSVFDAELRVRPVSGSPSTFLVEGRDISKFVKSAEALREREERLRGVLLSVAEGIVTITERGTIETANPAAETMFRAASGKLIGRHFKTLIAEDARDTQAHYFDTILSGNVAPGRPVEARGLRADDTQFDMEVSIAELRQGRHRLFTAILRDISERKENEDRIRRLAHHDALTGLPNRNLLNDRMNHALARIRRHGGRMAVLYVDLDNFKPINDRLGHKAGDAALREIAARLLGCVRSSDTVARVGGDEFVVVTEEIGHGAEAALVARKILDSLNRPLTLGDHSCSVSASIGIAVFPNDGYTMDEVCKAADVAMYRVKHSNGNGFCFFGDDKGPGAVTTH